MKIVSRYRVHIFLYTMHLYTNLHLYWSRFCLPWFSLLTLLHGLLGGCSTLSGMDSPSQLSGSRSCCVYEQHFIHLAGHRATFTRCNDRSSIRINCCQSLTRIPACLLHLYLCFYICKDWWKSLWRKLSNIQHFFPGECGEREYWRPYE